MKVVNFLKDNQEGNSPEKCLELLKEAYGIKYSIWEDKLVVLNYDQIASPKLHPITKECRSLVLELGTWEVVSRSFDRFLNYGESGTGEDWELPSMEAYEKMDGSLIGIFSYNGVNLYRTRSMIMPTSIINEWVSELTWKEAIETAIGGSPYFTIKGVTLICELTCIENRVVVKYENPNPTLTLLAVRTTEGDYLDRTKLDKILEGFTFLHSPKKYSFNTISECLTSAKNLPDLHEGFVMYKDGVPLGKVKNPAYVAAHHLRGEGLNKRRIFDLLIMGEVEEYLSVFPEDESVFTKYLKAYQLLGEELQKVEEVVDQSHLLSKKEFALSVMDSEFKHIAFTCRNKKVSAETAFSMLTRTAKYGLIDLVLKRV